MPHRQYDAPIAAFEADDSLPVIAAETLVQRAVPDAQSDDIKKLSTSVHEYLDEIDAELKALETELPNVTEAKDTANICTKTAQKVVRSIGFLNAYLDHFYTHPDYQASTNQKQEAMGHLLASRNTEVVKQGIGEMRAWVASMRIIDLDKAQEHSYDELYPPSPEQDARLARYAELNEKRETLHDAGGNPIAPPQATEIDDGSED